MNYDSQTALIVVDVQNDFADPRGSLYIAGGEEVVPLINREIREARVSGALVVHSQDWHPRVTPHFAEYGGSWPVHCVQHTWGAEFHPNLESPDFVIRKGSGGEDGYSAFSMREVQSGAIESTGLSEMLAERGKRKVVVVGLAGDVCVKATALDARDLGLEVTVPLEMTRLVDSTAIHDVVGSLRDYGVAVRTNES